MFVAKRTKFGSFLEQRMIQWINENQEIGNQTKFAEWLGVHPVVFNRHFNGVRVPRGRVD